MDKKDAIDKTLSSQSKTEISADITKHEKTTNTNTKEDTAKKTTVTQARHAPKV